MTATNGQGLSRHSMLFTAIEQAEAPTVELDELAPKIDEAGEADRTAVGGGQNAPVFVGQQPRQGVQKVITAVGK